MSELDGNGIVQAESLAQLGSIGERGLLADHIRDRVADETEHDERD